MTTLIQGGMVYDGTGGTPYEADVLLHGKTITRIGRRLSVRANHIIEARGGLVTPGFVDIASYADHYRALFADPAGTESLIRGITSLVVGHGGASIAPLFAWSILPERWWGNTISPAAHAAMVSEVFSLLQGRIGVNVGTLVGHATVREGITHGTPRDLTERELELLSYTLRHALKEGALGISVNLEYPRTTQVPRKELMRVAHIAEEFHAVLSLRLRSRTDHVKESLAEVLALSDATEVNLLLTDVEPHSTEEAAYRALMNQVTRASADHHVHFTTSGSGVAAFPLPLLLPSHWHEKEWDTMRARLTDRAMREELRSHLVRYRDIPMYVAAVADPSLKLFEGTPFAKWSLHEHVPFEEALMRLMEVTGFRAVLAMNVGEPELARVFAAHDRALIASGEAAAPALESSAHLKLLAFKDGGTFPLEQRIAKMTGAPAKKLGLSRRGILKEGYYADVLVIEKGTVRETFVNGVRAIAAGAPTGERSGTILTRA